TRESSRAALQELALPLTARLRCDPGNKLLRLLLPHQLLLQDVDIGVHPIDVEILSEPRRVQTKRDIPALVSNDTLHRQRNIRPRAVIKIARALVRRANLRLLEFLGDASRADANLEANPIMIGNLDGAIRRERLHASRSYLPQEQIGWLLSRRYCGDQHRRKESQGINAGIF